MEKDKISENVEFEVLYADGTRRRVPEGILFGVADGKMIFHNGTNRVSVLISTAGAALVLVDQCGLTKLFSTYIRSGLADRDVIRILTMLNPDSRKNESAENQAMFRLGQMDMKESVLSMLREAAQGCSGVTGAALLAAADLVQGMEVVT